MQSALICLYKSQSRPELNLDSYICVKRLCRVQSLWSTFDQSQSFITLYSIMMYARDFGFIF